MKKKNSVLPVVIVVITLLLCGLTVGSIYVWNTYFAPLFSVTTNIMSDMMADSPMAMSQAQFEQYKQWQKDALNNRLDLQSVKICPQSPEGTIIYVGGHESTDLQDGFTLASKTGLVVQYGNETVQVNGDVAFVYMKYPLDPGYQLIMIYYYDHGKAKTFSIYDECLTISKK